jgi:hypothetical protein
MYVGPYLIYIITGTDMCPVHQLKNKKNRVNSKVNNFKIESLYFLKNIFDFLELTYISS